MTLQKELTFWKGMKVNLDISYHPLKMDGWKMYLTLGMAYFQGLCCYVSFREGTCFRDGWFFASPFGNGWRLQRGTKKTQAWQIFGIAPI